MAWIGMKAMASSVARSPSRRSVFMIGTVVTLATVSSAKASSAEAPPIVPGVYANVRSPCDPQGSYPLMDALLHVDRDHLDNSSSLRVIRRSSHDGSRWTVEMAVRPIAGDEAAMPYVDRWIVTVDGGARRFTIAAPLDSGWSGTYRLCTPKPGRTLSSGQHSTEPASVADGDAAASASNMSDADFAKSALAVVRGLYATTDGRLLGAPLDERLVTRSLIHDYTEATMIASRRHEILDEGEWMWNGHLFQPKSQTYRVVGRTVVVHMQGEAQSYDVLDAVLSMKPAGSTWKVDDILFLDIYGREESSLRVVADSELAVGEPLTRFPMPSGTYRADEADSVIVLDLDRAVPTIAVRGPGEKTAVACPIRSMHRNGREIVVDRDCPASKPATWKGGEDERTAKTDSLKAKSRWVLSMLRLSPKTMRIGDMAYRLVADASTPSASGSPSAPMEALTSTEMVKAAQNSGSARTYEAMRTVDRKRPAAEASAASGEAFEHNGSGVLISTRNGTIVYTRPRTSMNGLVKKGDLLFFGTFGKKQISGTAYIFKKGCQPLGFQVSGEPYETSGQSIYLGGAVPVRAGSSCQPTGGYKDVNLVFETRQRYCEPEISDDGTVSRALGCH